MSLAELRAYFNSNRIICHFTNIAHIFLPLCLCSYCSLCRKCSSCTLCISKSCLPVNPQFCGHLSHGLSWLLLPSLAVVTPLIPYGTCHICPWGSGLICTPLTELADCKPLEGRVQVSHILSPSPETCT